LLLLFPGIALRLLKRGRRDAGRQGERFASGQHDRPVGGHVDPHETDCRTSPFAPGDR
jgi:hypothetical protein